MPKTTMKTTAILLLSALSLILNSCMVRTVTGEGGEVLYKKPVHGTPWESNQRQLDEVEATEESLGIYGR